jgi:hypothetical protein
VSVVSFADAEGGRLHGNVIRVFRCSGEVWQSGRGGKDNAAGPL